MFTYTVQPGDTLWSIAARYGVTPAQILRANNLTDADFIYVGQVLRIPGTGGQPFPIPTPGPFPGGQQLAQRVTRLERQYDFLQREITRLDRRVDALERRVRRLET